MSSTPGIFNEARSGETKEFLENKAKWISKAEHAIALAKGEKLHYGQHQDQQNDGSSFKA